ncbi:rod shape-determining protein [Nonomuraea sp. NPDC050310]|uniref:rod shape-determining protein n=1 Tax=Nonomuraea sp. NPDC050310 TaxID=3154935 RepID=UPI0033C41A7B
MGAWSPLSFMGKDVAVDLGSSRTQIYVRGQGVVVDEPSAVARCRRTGRIIATGAAALEADTPEWPLTRGTVTDFDGGTRLLAGLLRTAHGHGFARPRLVLAAPSHLGAVQAGTLKRLAQEAGARSVRLLDQPLAAALGAGLPVAEPYGHLVVDLRADTTEAAMISLGEVLVVEAIGVGVADFDRAIADRVRRSHGVLISLAEAARLRRALGAAGPSGGRCARAVGRRKGGEGVWSVPVSARQVHEAMERPLRSVLGAVRRVFDRISPELTVDVGAHGMVLTGGGTVARRLRAEFGVPVLAAGEPGRSVVLGLGRYVETSGSLQAAGSPALGRPRLRREGRPLLA